MAGLVPAIRGGTRADRMAGTCPAVTLWDALLPRLSSGDDSLGNAARAPEFWVSATSHPVPADDGSGLHICFTAPDRTAVDGFHKAALKTGGRDNGKPGLRPDYGPNYYAAFVVDPDGYRIEAWCGKQS